MVSEKQTGIPPEFRGASFQASSPPIDYQTSAYNQWLISPGDLY
jgi:hypothetical protein